MSKKSPSRLLLVVDACVARAAGETEHPKSSACRKYLRDILDICHSVGLTGQMREEWNRHQSTFARKWQRSMAAHRKPLRPLDAPPVDLDLDAFDPKRRAAVEKDLPLLEAALAADKVLVTLDDKLYQALEATPKAKRLRERIRWQNPLSDSLEKL